MEASDALFACSKGRRLPLAPPSPEQVHVHVADSSRAGIGVITSRRRSLREWWEREAFRKGVTVAELKRGRR